jgi:nitroreductase
MRRRSIRKYQDRAIPEEKIQRILEAAMNAPSAHNQQPWELVVITERKLLNSIPVFHPYSRMLAQAPMAILVCSTMKDLKSPDFWRQDCSAATENILIEATELGIGSVWLGVYPKESIMEGLRQLFALPANVLPFSLVALGYPAEEKEPSYRFDPVRVHRNGW